MKKKNNFLIFLLVIILLGASGAGGYFYRNMNAEKEMANVVALHSIEIEDLKSQIPETEIGFMLSKDLPLNTIISEEDLIFGDVEVDRMPFNAIIDKSKVIGKRTKIDMSMYSLLTDDLLYSSEEIENDLREQQFGYISLPDKLQSGDVVDIRILFPTGQDYVLLSKKTVSDIERLMDNSNTITKQTIWTYLNEKEIIRMGSAVVDAYLNSAELYAIEYVDPFIQEAAKVTYPENANVLELIKSNASIMDAAAYNLEADLRMNLESSLVQFASTDTNKISMPEQVDVSLFEAKAEDSTEETTTQSTPPFVEETDNSAEEVTDEQTEDQSNAFD